MKPLLLLLLILMLTACSSRNRTTANAVCTTVATCCRSVQSASVKGCGTKTRSSSDDLFSVSMHEISKEVLTW